MASKCNQCVYGDHPTKPIDFFKVILPQSLHEGKLMIPRKFVKKYGEDLPNTLFLKLPSGAEWKVLIFDMSGLEIDYPSKRVTGKKASSNQGNNKAESFQEFQHQSPKIENSEECRSCQKRKDNSSKASLQPCKVRRTSGRNKVETTSNFAQTDLPHSSRKCNDEAGKLEQLKKGKGNIDLKAKRSSFSDLGDHEAANKFKSEYPSFKVAIRLANLQRRFLRLPLDLVKTYFKPGKQIVTLRYGLQSWRIMLLFYSEFSKAVLSAGWAVFAMENALEVGDVCFFELLKHDSDDIVMKVSIFKHSSV